MKLQDLTIGERMILAARLAADLHLEKQVNSSAQPGADERGANTTNNSNLTESPQTR